MHYDYKCITIDSKKAYLSILVKGKSPGNEVVMIINAMNIFIHFTFCKRFC